MVTKNSIRRSLLEKRWNLTENQRQEMSQLASARAIEQPMLEQASTLYLYSATDDELSLAILMDWALRNHKVVGMPKVHGDMMDFYQIHSLEDLRPGAFGILEPVEQHCVLLHDADAICMVPGIGFDTSGGRLGHGKGFYDKYFAQYPSLIRIGCAYDVQMAECIPTEPLDIPMHYILTPTQWIDCRWEKREYDE